MIVSSYHFNNINDTKRHGMKWQLLYICGFWNNLKRHISEITQIETIGKTEITQSMLARHENWQDFSDMSRLFHSSFSNFAKYHNLVKHSTLHSCILPTVAPKMTMNANFKRVMGFFSWGGVIKNSHWWGLEVPEINLFKQLDWPSVPCSMSTTNFNMSYHYKI